MVILDSYSARRVQGKQFSWVGLYVEDHFFLISFKLGTCINLWKKSCIQFKTTLDSVVPVFSQLSGGRLFRKMVLLTQLPQHVNLYPFHGQLSVA